MGVNRERHHHDRRSSSAACSPASRRCSTCSSSARESSTPADSCSASRRSPRRCSAASATCAARCSAGSCWASSRTTGRPCSAPQWRDVVAFVVLVLVLMFRPTGILGESRSGRQEHELDRTEGSCAATGRAVYRRARWDGRGPAAQQWAFGGSSLIGVLALLPLYRRRSWTTARDQLGGTDGAALFSMTYYALLALGPERGRRPGRHCSTWATSASSPSAPTRSRC